MDNKAALKQARNDLLLLHKQLIDLERFEYEKIHGLLSPTEYLQLLLEEPSFSWLRQFSMLIVEIDEMFASKEGFPQELVDIHLRKVNELVHLKSFDEDFTARFSRALASNQEVADLTERVKDAVRDRGV